MKNLINGIVEYNNSKCDGLVCNSMFENCRTYNDVKDLVDKLNLGDLYESITEFGQSYYDMLYDDLDPLFYPENDALFMEALDNGVPYTLIKYNNSDVVFVSMEDI